MKPTGRARSLWSLHTGSWETSRSQQRVRILNQSQFSHISTVVPGQENKVKFHVPQLSKFRLASKKHLYEVDLWIVTHWSFLSQEQLFPSGLSSFYIVITWIGNYQVGGPKSMAKPQCGLHLICCELWLDRNGDFCPLAARVLLTI